MAAARVLPAIICRCPQQHNPVVDGGDDPAAHVADRKTVGGPHEAASKCNLIAGKELVQKLEMRANLRPAFNDQDVGGQKDAGCEKNPKS